MVKSLPELLFEWDNPSYQSFLQHQQNYRTERDKVRESKINILNQEEKAGLIDFKNFLCPYLVEKMSLVSPRKYSSLNFHLSSNLLRINFTVYYTPILIAEYPEAHSTYDLMFEIYPKSDELVTRVRFLPRGSKTMGLLVLQDAVLDQKKGSDDNYEGKSLREVLACFPTGYNHFEEINVKRFSAVAEALGLLEKAKDNCISSGQFHNLTLAREGIRKRLAAGALPGTEATIQKKSLEQVCEHYFAALKEICVY